MLEINEESLHSKLLEHKHQIGFGIVEGLIIIGGGLAFVCTIISGKIDNKPLNYIFWIFAICQIAYGIIQVLVAFRTKFNAEKLYKEIESLDVSPHRYSLIAIRDGFQDYKSNRILAKRFDGDWKEYMFLSFPTAAERDVESLTNAIAAALKVPSDEIHLYPKAAFYQPKTSADWKKVRAFYNTYYVASIDTFPNHLKKDEFEIDGVNYKWMTLEQMEKEAYNKENNSDVRRTFSRYIFTPNKNEDSCSELRKVMPKFPYNICIRLNRTCTLSCRFCLACNDKSLTLSTDAIKQCLNILKDNGVRRARLCGGEPTSHSGFLEIVKYSVSLGMETVIYSNLYDVDKIIPELVKYPVSVVTSIHGNKKFHNYITQNDGSYQKTYSNIKKLVASGVSTSIHMVLMNDNVNQVEHVIKKAIKNRVKKVTIQTLIPRENGRQFMEQNNSTILMLRQNLEKVKPLGEKYKEKITLHFNDMYEKEYYVLEPDGSIYLELGNGGSDQLYRRLV